MVVLQLFLLLGISSISFANFENTYECQTLQGAAPRITITIKEEFSDQDKLIEARATVNNEDSGEKAVFLVEKLTKRHPQNPDFLVVQWTSRGFTFEGYISNVNASRSFMGYSTSESEPRRAFSCYF